MTRTQAEVVTQIVTFDPHSPVPLFRQLYYCLREGILAGQLAPGSQLPSSRMLALDLGVARITVQSAYEQLVGEGYAEGRHGSGTYVARILPAVQRNPVPAGSLSSVAAPSNRRLSQRGAALMKLASPPFLRQAEGQLRAAFRPGLPALDLFPWAMWGRLLGRRWRNSASDLMDMEQAAGYLPLRQAITDYLKAERGVRCTAEQVIIVAGAQQAIDLALRVLVDPGDQVWLEDPAYPGVHGALHGTGAQPCPVPVDKDGLAVAAGILRYPEARLAYVTPTQQFPTGVTMSLNRRLALLEWAYRAGAWILEDDCGGDYHYIRRSIVALQGLDQQQRVVYLGSFAKTLFPALRIGYLVAPPDLVEPLLRARWYATQHPPRLEQAVLADFMIDGQFATHLRRMRELYAVRRAAFEDACQQELAGHLSLEPANGGMQLVGWLAPGLDDRAAARQAAAHGIDVAPLSAYRLAPSKQGGLLLGFAASDLPAIQHGVRQLARALESLMHR